MSRKGDDDSSSIYSLADDKLRPNYDNFVVCPYDKHHTMLATRLSKHLIKCGRNHPGNNMVRCPFNNTHVLQSSDLKTHLGNCSNLKDFFQLTNKEYVPSADPMAGSFDFIECHENWNDEPEAETYNPQLYCKKNLLMRNLVGGTPSQRREFRESQREKFKDLLEGKDL